MPYLTNRPTQMLQVLINIVNAVFCFRNFETWIKRQRRYNAYLPLHKCVSHSDALSQGWANFSHEGPHFKKF